jgi:hypothetical protein
LFKNSEHKKTSQEEETDFPRKKKIILSAWLMVKFPKKKFFGDFSTILNYFA